MELRRVTLPFAVIAVSVGLIVASLEAQMHFKYGGAMGSPSIVQVSAGVLLWVLVVAFLYFVASKLFTITYPKVAFVVVASFFISLEYPGFFRIALKQRAIDDWNMSSVVFNLMFEGAFVAVVFALFIADRALTSKRKRRNSAANSISS